MYIVDEIIEGLKEIGYQLLLILLIVLNLLTQVVFLLIGTIVGWILIDSIARLLKLVF